MVPARKNELLQKGWDLAPILRGEYLLEGIILGFDRESQLVARGLSEGTRLPWGMLLVQRITDSAGDTVGALAEGGDPLWLEEPLPQGLKKARDLLQKEAQLQVHYKIPPVENRTVILAGEKPDILAEAAVQRLRELRARAVWGVFSDSGSSEAAFDRFLSPLFADN